MAHATAADNTTQLLLGLVLSDLSNDLRQIGGSPFHMSVLQFIAFASCSPLLPLRLKIFPVVCQVEDR